MLSGLQPFPGNSEEEINDAVLNKRYKFYDDEWRGISDDAKDLITQMFEEESKRPTAKAVLKHPWFEKFKGKEESRQLTSIATTRLKKYMSSKKMKKIISMYLSIHSSDSIIRDVKTIFTALDTNQDGYITMSELKRGMKSKYENHGELQQLMNEMDLDRNGAVSYSEFTSALLGEEITK
mmetsp:Transcript_1980/g.2495  ORF Transcript_1980/g.2495 Transcript_1980/m.2495 type:complete len:180 (-) Transcript_1980:59-598(-)|eukprot:CAMPEP_0168354818 /NCGR_PEP_ID=MMETSP0213-20121227/24139_1 /TAXON_ID=151035 /ORGANISM="Euplotes harpa, Strain FSP1.4" /LENGTH=179 /DNA_ID=CAMNT_0008366825 /DNA_START=746 /DNA_END=1285 /DNA_ORIENTATION=+